MLPQRLGYIRHAASELFSGILPLGALSTILEV